MMNILHLVEFYSPSVGGAQECVKQISERLVKNQQTVTVFTSQQKGSPKIEVIKGVSVRRFDVAGNRVRGIVGADIEKFKQAVSTGSYDIIMCYAAQQWTFDLLNQIIDEVSAKTVLVPCGFSGLSDPAYRDYFKQMPKWLRNYDSLVLLSDTYQDAEFIKEHNIPGTTLIPNCADEREFGHTLTASQVKKMKAKYRLQNKVVCTIGGFTGMKGQMEAMAVFKRLPLNKVTLVVIGNNDFNSPYFEACKEFAKRINASKSSKNVVLLETGKDVDRQETIKLLQLSEVFLFMSYIEASPLVIFEAMAAGTPFVSTSVGNVKEIIKWTGAGLIVPGKKDSTGMFHGNKLIALVKTWFLLVSVPYQRQLARRGLRAFKTRYNWSACSKLYEELYKRLQKL